MKRKLQNSIFTLLLSAFALSAFAQSNISIKINHKLGGVQFENNMVATNDMNNDYFIDRLEYYLSGFSITHDGGQETVVEDKYVLVSLLSNTSPTTIDLGELNFQSLESVNFHFGVDQGVNHSDPSLWHTSHPLAPKFPSMHWGWSAGYRFLALEGKSGANTDQETQFHCVGDKFYKRISFPVSTTTMEDYSLELDADYNNLLSGIDISSGVIIHGDFGDMNILAENMVQTVFSVPTPNSIVNHELVKTFEIYPNPVQGNLVNIKMDVVANNTSVNIYDSTGRKMRSIDSSESLNFSVDSPGIYFVVLSDEFGKALAYEKLIAH